VLMKSRSSKPGCRSLDLRREMVLTSLYWRNSKIYRQPRQESRSCHGGRAMNDQLNMAIRKD
jgi:hypothetical protein